MARHREHVSWQGRDWQYFSHQVYNPLSLTLCATVLCGIFETCRMPFLVLYSHISPNIPEQLESLVFFNNTFLLPCMLSSFGGVQEEASFFSERKRGSFGRESTKPSDRVMLDGCTVFAGISVASNMDVLSLQGTACSGTRSMRGHGRAQLKVLIFLSLAQCWQT